MGFKHFFFIVFLVFFCANAFSQEVFVVLNPVSHSEPVKVFESEVAEFELVIANNEPVEVKNFSAQVFVGSNMVLLVNGSEKQDQLFSFVSIAPDSVERKTVLVKGISFSQNLLPLTVQYGVENRLHTYSASMNVEKSPLEFSARLEKNSLSPGEAGRVLFDLKNVSGRELKNVFAGISVPQGFENKSVALEFASFSQNQELLNSVFIFNAASEAVGEKNVLLTISFENDSGVHVVQKSFLVDVGEKNDFLFFFGAMIIVLLLFGFFFAGKKSKGKSK